MGMDAEVTAKEILKKRPRAAEVLEAELGPGIWESLDRPLEEVCRARRKEGREVLDSIVLMEPVPEDTDWGATPLYALVDRLTADHDRFRAIDLEAVSMHLEGKGQEDLPEEFSLADFRIRFHAFRIDFLLHMEEEESGLFPHILRLDAWGRHPELQPETWRGSVEAYAADILRAPEGEIMAMLAGLHRLAALQGEASSAALDRLHDLLEDLYMRVSRHASLETDVLIPRAEAAEKVLAGRPGKSQWA